MDRPVTAIIDVDNLSRTFNTKGQQIHALRQVSFSVADGETVALLGTNGAGKTTLTRILSTILLPTTGTARVLGFDVRNQVSQVRTVTSVILGGDRGLYTRLSGRENVRFLGMLNGASRHDLRVRTEEVLDQVGLSGSAGRLVETYSKGMRQRLHIAIGLIGRPRVLLLDEPTVGLDPVEAARLRTAIGDLAARGVTILLTSHHLVDVQVLASRVLMLRAGTLTHDLPTQTFARQAGFAAVVTVRGIGRPPAALTPLELTESADGWTARYQVDEWTSSMFTRLGAALDGTHVTDVQVAPADLDDAFARLTAEVT